jgi:pimeloyl-ACP methyl ester carboxylesterase
MSLQDTIHPLHINGLNGRILVLPSEKRGGKEILLLYGHHSSIERMAGFAEDLHQYGTVTLPDFPGFGGMDSFYKIGMKPTLDNLADYLAAFIKLRYKNKKIAIGGMSFGFVVATRMLQKYPSMCDRVELLISIVGFTHHDEFTFSKNRYRFYRYGASFFSNRLSAAFFRNVILHPSLLRLVYHRMHNAKAKFENLDGAEKEKAMDFEVHLWRCNDVRTYMDTTVSMLTLDNCQKKVSLPVHHISVSADQYFNNQVIEQHMRVIFTDYTEHKAVLDTHAPSVIADKQAAAAFVPASIRKVLKGTA